MSSARSRGHLASFLLVHTGLAFHTVARAQTPAPTHPAVPGLRVTDARLNAALADLVAGSESAAKVIEALSASGLPVAIGTPAEVAALSPQEGGPAPAERPSLLAPASDANDPAAGPPIAWVVFEMARTGAEGRGQDYVERVWLAIEVDSIERWIRATGWDEADARIRADLLATLAHEFVAHVGSIAASRRLADFCDDPHGAERLPERRSYALDVMNFARAYAHR
jgi:hypothetical protein